LPLLLKKPFFYSIKLLMDDYIMASTKRGGSYIILSTYFKISVKRIHLASVFVLVNDIRHMTYLNNKSNNNHPVETAATAATTISVLAIEATIIIIIIMLPSTTIASPVAATTTTIASAGTTTATSSAAPSFGIYLQKDAKR
jgi:uncharacterized membrane protein YpjA